MRRIVVLVAVLVMPTVACADQWVNGYIRQDGTYVHGYWRSSSDWSQYNNFSTKGNMNPYTGRRGYRAVQPSVPSINNTYRSFYDDNYLDPLNNGW